MLHWVPTQPSRRDHVLSVLSHPRQSCERAGEQAWVCSLPLPHLLQCGAAVLRLGGSCICQGRAQAIFQDQQDKPWEDELSLEGGFPLKGQGWGEASSCVSSLSFARSCCGLNCQYRGDAHPRPLMPFLKEEREELPGCEDGAVCQDAFWPISPD